jgi:protein-S-isoprenylcysteine O-methyltransferase Ste14
MNREKIIIRVFVSVFVVQFLLFLFFRNPSNSIILTSTALIICPLCFYFIFTPFVTLKKKGGVSKQDNYMETTTLVLTGPYAVLRHPQYLGYILLSIIISLITQSLLSLILSVSILIVTYYWTSLEEIALEKKFPNKYEIYKTKVPRFNFILGLIRKKKTSENNNG